MTAGPSIIVTPLTDRLIDLVQGSYEVFSEKLFGDDGTDAIPLLDAILASG